MNYNVICPYCKKPANLVGGFEVYPHRKDLLHLQFYKCTNGCDAYVGCCKNTTEPLGTLANEETRLARRTAHLVFDDIWKLGLVNRSKLYKQLSLYMKLHRNETHIAMFDKDQCKQVAKFIDKLIEEL